MRKLCVPLGFILSVFLITHQVFSVDCNQDTVANCKANNTCDDVLRMCQQKIDETRNTANTLSNQIQYMNSQISLTTLKIKQTEDKITNTQKEIDVLGSRIEGLDTSLSYLSKLLVKRIAEGYKKRSVSLLNLLLNSNGANDLIEKIKYQKSAQNNNQKVIIQVQEAKLNFEEQKKLREEKILELDNLKITLAKQQSDLQSQQQAKKNLLVATNNDEKTYQGLLDKARRELAGFSAFAQSAGLSLTTFGNGSNGWYYTQRDPQWGNRILPGSSSSVLLAGCAVTSVAMVCKNYGQGTTPSSIVNDSSKFIGGDLWNWAFSCDGKTTDWIGTSQDGVKNYVKSGTPVILRLREPSISGLHFIVVFAWDDGKNDFKIHDPYYGPDKFFSERYNWSQVTSSIVIH